LDVSFHSNGVKDSSYIVSSLGKCDVFYIYYLNGPFFKFCKEKMILF